MNRPDLDAIEARADAVPTCELLVQGRNARTVRAQVVMDDAGDLRFVADVNERWGPYADLFAASRTDIPALVAYARELEAVIANERGLGDPPAPGWTSEPNSEGALWLRVLLSSDEGDLLRGLMVYPTEPNGSAWEEWNDHECIRRGVEPTVRAAMVAADSGSWRAS